MANADKNILITPNRGQAAEPTIRFTGFDNAPLTLRVLDDGTVSFEGTAGQLFSVSDGLSGTIFSVNDISGIPSIEVLDTGVIKLGEYGGNISVGLSNAAQTVNIATGANASGVTKTVNVGTAGVSGSTTNINVGSAVSGSTTNIALNGVATAPTPAVDTNTTRVATTAFVVGQASSTNPGALGTVAIGTSLRYARADHVHPTTGLGLTSGTLAQFAATTSSQLAGVISDETGSGSLVFGTNPTFSGTVSITNITPSTMPFARGSRFGYSSSYRIVVIGDTNSANFNSVGIGYDPTSNTGASFSGDGREVFFRNAALFRTPNADNTNFVLPMQFTSAGSVQLNNTPTAPTAAADTNTTQLATTAFVVGQASSTNPGALGTVAVGTSLRYARADHVHPTTGLALLSGATFTGSIIAPAATASITSIRLPHGTAPTTPTNGDVWTTTTGLFARINGTSQQYSPLASPTFTGTPAAPTAAARTNTTQLATTAFVYKEVNEVAIDTKTASYTLAVADAGKVIEMNVASANNLTIPLNSSVAIPINSTIDIVQYGVGQTTIVPESGVTIRSKEGALKISGQYSAVTLYKRGTNEWVAMGDLSA
jgi:hypothetical protein